MRLSSLKQDFSVFYKTFQSFPRLFSSFQGSYFLYSFCFSRHFRHEILQSFIKLSSLLQDFPVFYKTFQSFTRLSSLLQDFPVFYKTFHMYAVFYMTLHAVISKTSVFYKTFQSFPRLFSLLQDFPVSLLQDHRLFQDFSPLQDNVSLPILHSVFARTMSIFQDFIFLYGI
jgi:hypothetical protein